MRISGTTSKNGRQRCVRTNEGSIPEDFRKFSRMVKFGIAVLDGSSILYANPILEYYLGYSPEELKGMDISELIPPDRIGEAFKAMDNIMTGAYQESIEMVFIGKDGSVRYLDLEGDRVDWGGERHLLISANDVTDRHEALERMMASEQKYLAVLEKSPNNIYLVDMETMRIIEANSALHRLLGYEEGKLVGKTPYDFIDHEVEDVDEKIRELPFGKYGFVGPRKYRTRDGRTIDVEVSANVIDYMGRKVISVVSWDVSELKRAHEEIMELNDILRLIGRITRHDIRNKLTIALGITGLMKSGYRIESSVIDESYKAIEKAIDITKRMNELESLIVTRKATRTVEIRDFVEDILRDHPVKYEIEGYCSVKVDDTFGSVIENLVGNSVFHGGADRIEVNIDCTDTECILRITDNGKGIPDTVKEKIFEEGFSHGENKGTGLGLYIVKKVMERYGGEVLLEESSPRGTTFVLKLLK